MIHFMLFYPMTFYAFFFDKSWGLMGMLQETLALLEELRSSGHCPDGGCLHAARLAAKEAGPKTYGKYMEGLERVPGAGKGSGIKLVFWWFPIILILNIILGEDLKWVTSFYF